MNPPPTIALTGARIFDGTAWHDDKALLLAGDRVAGIRAVPELPPGVPVRTLAGGMLVPGFVDLQVNGGGGVLLNDTPTAEGIATICQAHRPSGTTALLPTLVTDTPATTERALAAGQEAQRRQIPGFLGLHLEGPHLATARRGAHDPALIRRMTEADLERLIRAAPELPLLLTTVAPESVTGAQIRRLTQAGIRVSLGHSDASFAVAQDAAANGATLVTHLFNAMSPLAHRAPGMVGSALQNGALHAGLIADGIHVDPVSIAIALRAKRGPGRIFLVTDAMAPAGTALTEFTLNGRLVERRDGRLALADGTLAGADTTMIQSVRFMIETIGLPLEEALRMASLYPAEAVGLPGIGHLRPGARADILHLSAALEVSDVWIGGIADMQVGSPP
ncbi:MAG TPA: N-acetylglucosamine-6-phosphate deacetylase [Acidocella sp.]|jgi:N-acetylglucosamine-6-phosphate deacetylase|nr:N-acetylglucosamine-6-phosphate deacetylase [Acidocella sp.]